jgi:hypothetical protein
MTTQIIRIIEKTGKVLPRPRQVARVAETKKKKPTDLAPQLEGAFRLMGHDPATARIMAAGRRGRSVAAGSMVEVGRRLGLAEGKARTFARGRGVREAATDGSGFKATDYAYAPDPEDPTTWRFLLTKQPGDGALGAYDSGLVQKAAAALAVDEWAVAQPDIPKADLAFVKQTVAGAWTQSGLALADMPPALTEAALRTAFQRMGLSDAASAVAAKGRA